MKRTGLNRISKIINESDNELYIRRRLSDIKKIVKYAKNNSNNLTDFLSNIRSLLVHLNNGGEDYDIVVTINFIVKYFKSDIEEIVNKSKNLNEATEELRYRRYIREIDQLISDEISTVAIEYYERESFCKLFTSPKEVINLIVDETSSIIYYRYFSHMDDESDEWGDIFELNRNYIKNIYGDDIILMWNRRCRSVRS